MSATLELPVWLVSLVAVLAALALITHCFVPGCRWLVRRRVNRVIDDVGARLDLELPPFLLTRREALIDRLVYDARVQDAVAVAAAERDLPRKAVIEQVEGYAREIVPGFNAYFYFRIGYWIARHFLRFFYRVRVGYANDEALDRIDANASLVLVMNHRSNFDYLLVTYLASRRATLSYAAGEWTLFWPMGNLLRAMGAYFVRRGANDPLYRRVLERYVQMAVEGRVPQGIYPEGSLSRDGGLQKPKLGLLDYMIRDFDPAGERDIVFIPIGINYERVVEDRGLIRHQEEEMVSQRGTAFVLKSTGGFFLRTASQIAYGRRRKFGRACANFGTPLSLKTWLATRAIDLAALDRTQRFACVGRLADELMADIAGLIPVLPISLVAAAFWESPERRLSELDLQARAHQLVAEFESAGAHVYLPFGEENLAVGDGLQMLLARRMVREVERGRYVANPAERVMLEFYVKPVAHFVHTNVSIAE